MVVCIDFFRNREFVPIADNAASLHFLAFVLFLGTNVEANPWRLLFEFSASKTPEVEVAGTIPYVCSIYLNDAH